MRQKEDEEGTGGGGLRTATSVVTNLEVWAQDEAEVHGRVSTLYRKLLAMESVLDRCAAVLRMSQPNNMAGVLDLRWWVVSGNKHRDPVLVRWLFMKFKRLRPYRAKRIDGVAKEAPFQINAAHTMETIGLVRAMQKNRDVLKTKLWKIKQITARLDEFDGQVAQAEANLDYLMQAVVRNLSEAGYDIHPDKLRELGLLDPDD